MNKGLKEGDFAEKDLIEHTIDPFILKYKNREKFEIHALLFDGKTTGFGSCSICSNKSNRNTVFKISDGFSGMRDELIRRHCRHAHATDEEKEAAKTENLRKKNQLPVTDYLQGRLLTSTEAAEICELQLEVVSSTHIPLSFFSKDVMRRRDAKMLEVGRIRPTEVKKIDKGPESLKRDSRKKAAENREVIRENARKVAEEGRLALVMDHKSNLNMHGDPENHGFGIALCETTDKLKRQFYILDYIPTDKTDIETTVPLARKVLEVSYFYKRKAQNQVGIEF